MRFITWQEPIRPALFWRGIFRFGQQFVEDLPIKVREGFQRTLWNSKISFFIVSRFGKTLCYSNCCNFWKFLDSWVFFKWKLFRMTLRNFSSRFKIVRNKSSNLLISVAKKSKSLTALFFLIQNTQIIPNLVGIKNSRGHFRLSFYFLIYTLF